MGCAKNMTKQVVIKVSGKVEGIRGLYVSPVTKRVYVRFSFNGVDKQLTIHPKNMTFSELKREASKAMTVLKRSVSEACESNKKYSSCKLSSVERGVALLPDVIAKHWSFKGRTQKYIDELIRVTKGLAICTSNNKTDISEINKFNSCVAEKIINQEGLSDCQRFRLFNGISLCFGQLIKDGRHFGINPVRDIPKPSYCINRRSSTLNFDDAALVLSLIRNDASTDKIKRMECELFLMMAVETGQRPRDIYMFNVSWIDGEHCQFRSHKTSREHRVMHLLSIRVRMLISDIIIARSGVSTYSCRWKNKHGNDECFDSFWRLSLYSYESYINRIIRNYVGSDISLYSARHFFVTEMFRRTESEFWAEVFTHEGRNTNQRNYLHPDQKRADEILTGFCDTFESIITSLEIAGLEDCKPDSFYTPF